jgi:hypothetical protein
LPMPNHWDPLPRKHEHNRGVMSWELLCKPMQFFPWRKCSRELTAVAGNQSPSPVYEERVTHTSCVHSCNYPRALLARRGVPEAGWVIEPQLSITRSDQFFDPEFGSL